VKLVLAGSADEAGIKQIQLHADAALLLVVLEYVKMY